MNNKKRSKKKGHVLTEISDVGVGPCGGGTSNMPEATKHPVSTLLVLKRNTGNILGSGSIGYVSDAYRICCMGLPKYIFRLAQNPIGHVHKHALHDSVQVQQRNPTLHRSHILHCWVGPTLGPLLDAAVCLADSPD